MLQKVNIENTKSKESHLSSQLEEAKLNLKNEMNKTSSLELKVKSNLLISLKSTY